MNQSDAQAAFPAGIRDAEDGGNMRIAGEGEGEGAGAGDWSRGRGRDEAGGWGFGGGEDPTARYRNRHNWGTRCL